MAENPEYCKTKYCTVHSGCTGVSGAALDWIFLWDNTVQSDASLARWRNSALWTVFKERVPKELMNQSENQTKPNAIWACKSQVSHAIDWTTKHKQIEIQLKHCGCHYWPFHWPLGCRETTCDRSQNWHFISRNSMEYLQVDASYASHQNPHDKATLPNTFDSFH